MKRVRKKRVAKQIDDAEAEGDLTLLVSTDAMDDEGDVVEQRWTFPSQIPFLFSHDNKRLPVGHVVSPRVVSVVELPADVQRELSDDASRATIVDVDVDEDDEFGQAVLRKYRRGDMEDSSVGFDPEKFEHFGEDEAGRIHFLESELKEVSATPIGANSDTTVLRKEFDPGVLPPELLDDATDKEGRRNAKRDEAAMVHAKEMLEFALGEREHDGIGECPFATAGGDTDSEMGGMDDDKTGDADTTKMVTPYQDLPLADRETDWSGRDAVDSMREAAGLEEGQPLEEADEMEPLRLGHLWHADEIETMDDLKLPYAQVTDGALEAVPRGIFAVAQVIQGARGGADIPEGDMDGIREHVARYYAKMRDEFDDFDRVAPWDREESTSTGEHKVTVELTGDVADAAAKKLAAKIEDISEELAEKLGERLTDDPKADDSNRSTDLPWSADDFFEDDDDQKHDGDSGDSGRKGQTVPDELMSLFD